MAEKFLEALRKQRDRLRLMRDLVRERKSIGGRGQMLLDAARLRERQRTTSPNIAGGDRVVTCNPYCQGRGARQLSSQVQPADARPTDGIVLSYWGIAETVVLRFLRC